MGGNFLADAIRSPAKAGIKFYIDAAMVNGGGIRGNKVYEKGDLTIRMLTAINPFGNDVIMLNATGKAVKSVIEVGLSGDAQNLKGNFMQVSGLKVTADLSREVGSRLTSLKLTSEDNPEGTEVTDDTRFSLA